MTTDDLPQQFPGKEKSVLDLVGFLHNGSSDIVNYALFLGAGASATSGVLTGSRLVKSWREELFNQLNPNSSISESDAIKQWLTQNYPGYQTDAEYGYLFERKYSMPKQRRDFIESMISGKLPSIGYPYLVRLAEKKAFNVVFTTNFDDLLNEAFYQFSTERPVVCAHDSSVAGISVTSSKPKIIKLHGDCLYNNLKNSPLETNQLTKNMEEKIGEFAKVCGLFVVGYSGFDYSVMRILNDLIDNQTYFQNGVYWCFRKGDEISPETAKLLRKPGVFYAVVDGFDELMADLYTPIVGKSLPFNARPGSDFAAKIIDSYLKDETLSATSNDTIQSHINLLREEQSSSLVGEALKTLYKEQGDDTKIRDVDFIKYIELERLFRSRDYKIAFDRVRSYVEQCDSAHFKRILAERLYHAATALYQPEEATKAIELLRSLQPENCFLCLPLCDVTEDRSKRLEILKEGVDAAPYEEAIQHRYASELENLFHAGTEKSRPTPSEIVQAYKKAINLHPAIGNPAWKDLFNYLKSPFTTLEEKDSVLKWITDQHMAQDAYDYRSVDILVNWSKATKSETYENRQVSEFVIEAFQRHFPRRYAGHLSVIRDLCIESGQFAILNDLLPICEGDEGIEHDSSYVHIKMDLLYRVYRDLDAAIHLGEDFVRRRPSPSIEKTLFHYYLSKNELDKGRAQLDRLTGAVDIDSYLASKAHYLDCCGKHQDAIDAMITISKRNSEGEDHVMNISFYQLRMNDFKGAFETTKQFFEKNNYSLRYDTAMINYEYARFKLKKSVSQQRLQALAQQSQNKGVQAVANLLLSKEDLALDILGTLIKSDFSMLHGCSRWPDLSSVRAKVLAMEPTLLAEKRSFPERRSYSALSDGVIDV